MNPLILDPTDILTNSASLSIAFGSPVVSYEPLHHKYRPQTFAHLVGQDAIATTLTNAIESQRIAPAYLFTGPRGTGKTSSARILAKSLNCLASTTPTATPCGVCEVCKGITNGSTLDVIEIDAASNTGVDNIRELIERSQFAPVQCRYKVYVIDECHMLSTAAFNALLKTLEEPPDRVIFVLATTDPQRVLPTIISRCQRFDFRRIPLDAMIKHLQHIAEKENIDITLDAIAMVAQIAQGGLRDAESLLDQLSLLSGEITVEKVWDLVGAVPERDLMSLLEAIASENTTAVLDCTRHLLNRGREPLIVLQNLAGFYRDLLIAKTAPNRSDLVALTQPTWEKLCQFVTEKNWSNALILAGQQHLRESEVQIKNTTQPRLWLEVTLLGLLPAALGKPVIQQTQVPVFSQPQPQPASIPVVPSSPPPPPKPPVYSQPEPEVNITPEPTPKPAISEPEIATSPVEVPVVSDSNLEQIWRQVLECVQPNGTQSLFRQMGSLVQYTGNVAYIGLKSQPLLKIAQPKLPSLETAFYQVFGQRIKIQLQVGNKPQFNQTQSVVFNDNKPEAIAENTSSENLSPTIEETEVSSAPNSNFSSELQPEEKQPLPVSEPEAIAPSILPEKPAFSNEQKPEFLFNTSEKIEFKPEQQEAKLIESAAQKLIDLFDGKPIKITQKPATTIIVEPETPPNYSYSSEIHETEEFIDYGEPDEENPEDLPF